MNSNNESLELSATQIPSKTKTSTTHLTTICFIANYNKTYFFEEIAKNLQNEGTAKIFWITTSNKQRKHLQKRWGEECVLHLPKSIESSKAIADFRLNEIIYGDRVQRHFPHKSLDYLSSIQKPIVNFLTENSIKFVFGELTWAHEILIHRITNEYLGDTRFLNPHTIRIPSGRFSFFTDEKQSVILESSTPEAYFDSTQFLPRKPDYLAQNNQHLATAMSIRARLDRLRRFFTMENIDPTDPTMISNRLISWRIHASEEIRRAAYSRIKRLSTSRIPKSTPFVFVALHKQPEASIDVLGRYYEDQAVNIKNIWRRLPENWLLVIKEHSNAIGDRPLNFYKDLLKLPGVRVIDENTDSYDLILSSSLVATVSGTVAYEAALLGRPSVTFAPCFFNGLSLCKNVDLSRLESLDLRKLSNTRENLEQDMLFKSWLFRNSYIGKISDPVSDHTCMNAENITQVAQAFRHAICL